MDKFNIDKSIKINNFFKRVNNKYYGLLALLQSSKDKELNALIIGQLIVITILGLIILGIKIF